LKRMPNKEIHKPANIVQLSVGDFIFKVELNETATAKKLLNILPVNSTVNTWGSEIYFSIPMDSKLENGAEVVDIGTVGFWPPGKALCIFFGRTPASTGEKPQAASPVTIVGKVMENEIIKKLQDIKSGEKIKVSVI
jgi:uncharacterized protein